MSIANAGGGGTAAPHADRERGRQERAAVTSEVHCGHRDARTEMGAVQYGHSRVAGGAAGIGIILDWVPAPLA